MGEVTLGSLPPMEFSFMWGGAKSWVITITQGLLPSLSVSAQGGANTRALKMKRGEEL